MSHTVYGVCFVLQHEAVFQGRSIKLIIRVQHVLCTGEYCDAFLCPCVVSGPCDCTDFGEH
jgi:hypothetical protein